MASETQQFYLLSLPPPHRVILKQILTETSHSMNMCLCIVVFSPNLDCNLQRKRMVVPAALKIVRLKPSRKVSLNVCYVTDITVQNADAGNFQSVNV